MGKDLHSQKVEDWNLGIIKGLIYLLDNNTAISGVYLIDNGDSFEVGDLNEKDFPMGIEIKGDKLMFESYPDGHEYRYDDKGNMIWSKHPDGRELAYTHG